MKPKNNRPFLTVCARFSQMAFFVFAILLLGNGVLRAEMDISANQNGAFVLYSSPLSKGTSPYRLLNGKKHEQPFAANSSQPILVIDLGTTYTVTHIRNLPDNARSYLLNKRPTDDETWASLIASGAPGATDGTIGQYLVIVYNEDPAYFSDPLVDGNLLSQYRGSIFGAGFGLGNSTPIAITPLTSTEIISH